MKAVASQEIHFLGRHDDEAPWKVSFAATSSIGSETLRQFYACRDAWLREQAAKEQPKG